jgi:predicted ATPase/class 3 adenylate cyclase
VFVGSDPDFRTKTLSHAIATALVGSYTRLVAESRKTVTIVFSDVSGSTSLGERLDPETARRVMERYFAETRSVLEGHGGTVEKFIGDAVMAVFGIPQLHEDDALRAVRAAAELRERLADLNEGLERDWGVQIAVRTGVNSGEVVAGDAAQGQSFATGDAVNVAARLEQAASPGEILIGDATRRLLREAVRVEAVEPLALKGKAEPIDAWRLVEVLPDVPPFTRKLDAPFVGREREFAELEEAFERSAEERVCRLVTVLGPPGIGKSRLGAELRSAVEGGATVLTGRCLPYGEGITFWPLAEIMRELDLGGALRGEADADAIARRIEAAVGLAESSGRIEETFWAVRRLFETLAKERPLVLVLEDIHWAEPGFLDLIEYLAQWARDAPVLLVCLARPELLEERPSWTRTEPSSMVLTLEPLSEAASQALAADLLPEARLTERERDRIVEVAEGNPLFLEQMVAFATEDGGELGVPPTIQALLAARLDRLAPEERTVIERAAVAGKVFQWSAVSDLSPDHMRPRTGSHLLALTRKGLIGPHRSDFAGEDAFRFQHMLIRQAAYEAIPKATRSELHERFAGWLERSAGKQGREPEELAGYHLEQAYRYLSELGPVDERGRELAGLAAERLAAAGARVFDRGDVVAAANLLGRATALLPEAEPARVEMLFRFALAIGAAGKYREAESLLTEAIAAAQRFGLRDVEWYAKVERLSFQIETDPHWELQSVHDVVEEAISVFEELGDDRGQARAWRLLCQGRQMLKQFAAAEKPIERALEHARRARDLSDETSSLLLVLHAIRYGPTPVDEGHRRAAEILEQAEDPWVEAYALRCLGDLGAMEGRFEEARRLIGEAKAIYENLGLEMQIAHTAEQESAYVEMLGDDPAAAERELRLAYEVLERGGMENSAASAAGYLGHALCAQGRYEEAARFAGISENTAVANDANTQILWRRVRARVLAREGVFESAEALAREAARLAEKTDDLDDRGDTLMDLADVLSVVGRLDEAATTVVEALRLYEKKGNVVSGAKAAALLAELTTTRTR